MSTVKPSLFCKKKADHSELIGLFTKTSDPTAFNPLAFDVSDLDVTIKMFSEVASIEFGKRNRIKRIKVLHEISQRLRMNVLSIIRGVIGPIEKSDLISKGAFLKIVVSSFNILAKTLEELSLAECKKRKELVDLSETVDGLREAAEVLRQLIPLSPKIPNNDVPKAMETIERL